MTTRYISVEVSLDDFSDEDIQEEYEARFTTAAADGDAQLNLIYHALRQGKQELAIELVWEHLRDKLGVVV